MHTDLMSDSITVNQREISYHGSGVLRSSAASAWRDGQAELSTTSRLTYVIVVQAAVITGLGVDQLVRGHAYSPIRKHNSPTSQTFVTRFADDRLRALFNHVNSTWLTHTTWTPANVCVYRRHLRTKIDLEG